MRMRRNGVHIRSRLLKVNTENVWVCMKTCSHISTFQGIRTLLSTIICWSIGWGSCIGLLRAPRVKHHAAPSGIAPWALHVFDIYRQTIVPHRSSAAGSDQRCCCSVCWCCCNCFSSSCSPLAMCPVFKLLTGSVPTRVQKQNISINMNKYRYERTLIPNYFSFRWHQMWMNLSLCLWPIWSLIGLIPP